MGGKKKQNRKAVWKPQKYTSLKTNSTSLLLICDCLVKVIVDEQRFLFTSKSK